MAVDVERRGATEVICINRPEARNALDPETSQLLTTALDNAEADDDVRVVIMTGAGDRAFCAGMDLKAFAGAGPVASPLTAFIRRLYAKPLIAAVNGPAVAGGFELVLTCDLVVAADTAFFALPEVARGLYAAGGGTFLPQRLPLAIALELGLTGGRIDAARAQAFGLVNRVVPASEVMDEAIRLADEICANSPLGVRVTKALMVETTGDASAGWTRVDQEKALVFSSNDAREGATAFVERRQPIWTAT